MDWNWAFSCNQRKLLVKLDAMEKCLSILRNFLRSLNKLVCLLHENMRVSERLISLELLLEVYISVFIYTVSIK